MAALTLTQPKTELSIEEQEREWLRCSRSPAYFVDEYVQIYDATLKEWIPFRLWREQFQLLKVISANRLVVILKARQLGLTWLVLAFALWLMLFGAAATVLIFSKRDDEAVYLLDERLKGMYNRLPAFLQALKVSKSNDHTFELSNGSVARAFPTTAGDSYTASLVIADEFDLLPEQGRLMKAVKPTIDGGGRMVLLSRADKAKPQTEFKNTYRSARAGLTDWVPVFLPWYVRPGRDEAWYASIKAEIVNRTGGLDELYEQYPATDAEALAPRTLDKRIAPAWLLQCYRPMDPIDADGAPAIPGLEVYALPEPGRSYRVGVDPAEGNPTSDDSAIEVVDLQTGEEVASLAGKFQPSTTAAHADRLGRWYNDAAVMVERNNHGHAVLLWLRDHSRLAVLLGDDGKPGWLSNTRGKALLYDQVADAFRHADAVLHNGTTYAQLASIEGSTLRAPEGEYDDRAVACGLALIARAQYGGPAVGAIADIPLEEYRRERRSVLWPS